MELTKKPTFPQTKSVESIARQMFDAVKVDTSAAASRAANATSAYATASDDDNTKYQARKGNHATVTPRQMLDRQSTLVRKVTMRRVTTACSMGSTLLWQIAGGFLVLMLVSLYLTSSKGSGGRKGWDNKASLPYGNLDDGEIGSAWTTSRLCKHFGAPTPSRVRFVFGVSSAKAVGKITENWRRTDIIQVNVGFRLHTDVPKENRPASGWRARATQALDAVTGVRKDGSPVVTQDTSPYSAPTSKFEFAEFLRAFVQGQLASGQLVGKEQGLMVTFLDPRAIKPGLKILRRFVVTGALPGPLLVDGEILPGPGGFLSQLGSVFVSPPEHEASHDHEASAHHLFVPPVPGDVDEAMRAKRLERTFEFDPKYDFVDAIKKYTPGVIISMRWSTHGGCVDGAVASDARAAYAKWYQGNDFDWDWAKAEQAEDAAAASAAAATKMFDFVGAMAKGIAGSLPKGRRLMDHAGDSEAHGDEEVEEVEEEEVTEEKEDDEEEKETEDDEEAKVEEETEEVSEKKDDDDETKVDDTEDDEDSDDDSEDDESEEDQLPEVTAPLPPSTKASSVSANTYDANTASLRNEAAGFFGASPIYDDAMFDDAYWLFRNAGFGGDVVFGVELCVLASPDPDGDATTQYPYKKLLQQKLGYTVMLRGNADDAALAFARGDVGKELGQETHGTNRGAPEAANTFVGDVRRVVSVAGGGSFGARAKRNVDRAPLRPTQVLTPTKLAERLASEEGKATLGEDGEL